MNHNGTPVKQGQKRVSLGKQRAQRKSLRKKVKNQDKHKTPEQ